MRNTLANKRTLRVSLSLSAAMIALVPVQAFAQGASDSAGSTGASTSNVGDIVVTARRVEERLEKVPVAITALSAEALTERRVAGESDLQQAVPGLTIRTTNSDLNTNYTLRGQGVDAFSTSATSVATYYNEFSNFGFRTVEYFDMASLQVLKGPQGTLFGRNSTGGAVLYTSAPPVLDQLTGYGRVSYGNYDDIQVEGAVNVPLGHAWALRVAGEYKSHGGYQNNWFDGSHPDSLTTRDLRGSLLYSSGPVRNLFTAQYTAWTGKGEVLRPILQGDGNPTHLKYGFASFAYTPDFVSPQLNVRAL